jgi:hypothetical protein
MLTILYAALDGGDVGGDAPSLVAGEEVRRRATARLLLEIDVGQRLPAVVPDDEASAYCDSCIFNDAAARASRCLFA